MNTMIRLFVSCILLSNLQLIAEQITYIQLRQPTLGMYAPFVMNNLVAGYINRNEPNNNQPVLQKENETPQQLTEKIEPKKTEPIHHTTPLQSSHDADEIDIKIEIAIKIEEREKRKPWFHGWRW